MHNLIVKYFKIRPIEKLRNQLAQANIKILSLYKLLGTQLLLPQPAQQHLFFFKSALYVYH